MSERLYRVVCHATGMYLDEMREWTSREHAALFTEDRADKAAETRIDGTHFNIGLEPEDEELTRVMCDYCGERTFLVPGRKLYPHIPKLADQPYFVCWDCEAHVGCHPGTTSKLGRLANAELRKAKQDAHAAFDPLWRRKMAREQLSTNKARGAGYLWLSKQLGIAKRDCHIGMMDLDQCRRVVEVCEPFNRGRA